MKPTACSAGAWVAWLLPLIAGCASTTAYGPGSACQSAVSTAMVRVVAKRPSSFVGSGVQVLVSDDDQPVGLLGNGGQLCWDRHPGHLRVVQQSPGIRSSYVAEVRAGQTVVLELPLGDPIRRVP